MLVSAPSFSTSPSPLDPHLASVPPRPPRTLLEPARHPGTAAFALFRGTRTRRTRAHSEQMSRGRTMAPRSATTHLDASTSRPLPQAGSVTARACFTELQPLVARHTASSGDCPPPPAPRRRPTDASPASSPLPLSPSLLPTCRKPASKKPTSSRRCVSPLLASSLVQLQCAVQARSEVRAVLTLRLLLQQVLDGAAALSRSPSGRSP